MPIYCYECKPCGTIIEKMVPMGLNTTQICIECKSTMMKITAAFAPNAHKGHKPTAEGRIKEFIEDARRTLDQVKKETQEDFE